MSFSNVQFSCNKLYYTSMYMLYMCISIRNSELHVVCAAHGRKKVPIDPCIALLIFIILDADASADQMVINCHVALCIIHNSASLSEHNYLLH